MSRARERLIIVADLDRIHRRRPHRDAVGDFFKAALTGCDHLDPIDIITASGLRQRDLDQLRSDIDQATSTVEIWSELVDDEGAASLAPHLRAAADRGCATTVWYRPRGSEDIPPGLTGLARTEVMLRPCTPVLESPAGRRRRRGVDIERPSARAGTRIRPAP